MWCEGFYWNQIKKVEELHQCVEEEWDSLDQRMIDSAIRELRGILSAYFAADGGHSNMHCERDCFALWRRPTSFNAARLFEY